jgi:4-aminobutyrate aminotransferase-like enzyme
MPATGQPLPVVSAEGVRLRLADGSELIDGMASWWCAVHGYRHPALDGAVRTQLDRMAHVTFGGLTHEPAVRLATALVELTPDAFAVRRRARERSSRARPVVVASGSRQHAVGQHADVALGSCLGALDEVTDG